MKKKQPLWPRVLGFCIFLVSVNLLAGVIAITLNYPSLYNVNASFGEYAVPLPFNWALAHWPSMLLYGIPLLLLTRSREKFALYFRLFCVISFCLLLLELDEKIPFLLFPKVDAIIALTLSLVLVPPDRRANPVLFATVNIALVAAFGIAAFYAFSFWQHRTPQVTTTAYADGAYELRSIVVSNALHEMRFEMDLGEHLPIAAPCMLGQQVASDILRDYPFDSSYTKVIEVRFNPVNPDLPENAGAPYPMGEISLNEEDRGPDGAFACSLTYLNDIF